MNLKITMLSLLAMPMISFAQGPEVTSWMLNTTGATGYGGNQANCQQVEYSNDYVYVHATGIPEFTIGPWGNPNVAGVQNFVFKIPRNPIEELGTKTETGLGQASAWVNGVAVYNSEDGFSYYSSGQGPQADKYWLQDAVVSEGSTMDACWGHADQSSTYHHHSDPSCLYVKDGNHSPIIGFAFDGFPIYGAYGYDDPFDPNSGVVRMESGYSLRNITDRTTEPDGTPLPVAKYGPSIASTPLGVYVEDYEWLSTNGHLDEHNGRECYTPEYPDGTYAYFVTVDANMDPQYPYIIGPTYYGVVEMDNIGPNGANVTVTEPTTVWDGTVSSVATEETIEFELYPNPTNGVVNLALLKPLENPVVTVKNTLGQIVFTQPGISGNTIDVSSLPAGMYFIQVSDQNQISSSKSLVIN